MNRFDPPRPARHGLLITLLAPLAFGFTAALADDGREPPARGAFTCDFELQLDPAVPPQQVAAVIEHDRQMMSGADAAAGFRLKVLPFAAGSDGGVRSGGRYLFDRWAQARSYERFVKEEFKTFDPNTGQIVPFLQRTGVLKPDCHSWRVIGAAETGLPHDAPHHLRTERWSVPQAHDLAGVLHALWREVRESARQIPGVGAVWLLANREQRLVSLVIFQPRTAASPGSGFDQLMAAPSPLQAQAARRGWTPVFTAGHLTLTQWLPFKPGDRGRPSLWPNAELLPPLPAPGDGVCSPSRGEQAANEPACLATCGNARADAGETWLNCPADVSPYRD